MSRADKKTKKINSTTTTSVNTDSPQAKKPLVEMTIKAKKLGQAPREYSFILKDGRKLSNLLELANELERMNDDVFRHHVNDVRNDFANWIKDVLKENKLADELYATKSKEHHQIALFKHLVKRLLN